MIKNKVLATGMAAILLGSMLSPAATSFAHEAPGVAVTANHKAELKEQQVVEAAAEWMKKVSYVQSGGLYEEGEYKPFTYKGRTYRYLSKDIDTKKELIHYLTKSVTNKYAEKFIKDLNLIQHKGRLAQLEADGGSLLQWNKAQAVYVKTTDKARIYKMIVPIGETKEKSIYYVHMKKTVKEDWKIDKFVYQKDINLDIPGNINPAFIFFRYLLVDSLVSEEQLADRDLIDVNAFKKGIRKLEIRELKELGHVEDKVEYEVIFHADLKKNYKGPLDKGQNHMFFLIENTGAMEFKIVSVKTDPHLY